MKNISSTILLLPLVLLFAFTSCDNGERYKTITLSSASINENESNKRFVITRLEIIRDSTAYNEERGIYLIKDTQNGQEYFGISGIGISELGDHKSGKLTINDER